MELSAEIIDPFLRGTVETFKVQCGLDVKAGKPSLRSKQAVHAGNEIAGVIGVASEKFNGSLALVFTEDVFLKIVSNMFGEDYPEMNDEVVDGVGELLNIIVGFGKTELTNKGYKVEASIPTVIRGKELQLNHMVSTPCIMLPMSCQFGSFYVEIGWDSKKQTAKVAA